MTRRAFDKIAAGLNEAVADGRAAPRLTTAQESALMWMHRNGGWRLSVYANDARLSAIASLCAAGLVESTGGKPGEPFYGATRYRLTPAGIAAREEMEKE